METQKLEARTPIILSNITFHIPWGPCGYYEQGRELFYKRVTVDNQKELRDSKDYYGELRRVSIGTYKDWSDHFKEQGNGKVVPPLPLWVAMTEKLYEQKHPALDKLIQDFREEGLSTATTIRYAGSHVVHDFGSEQVRVHCYVPPTVLGEGFLSYEKAREREAWRKVFQALLLTDNLDRTIEILREVYGDPISLNLPLGGEWNREPNVLIRLHPHFGEGFVINGVSPLYSTGDLQRVRGVRLEKLLV